MANTLPGHHPRQDLDNDTYVPELAYAVKTTDAKRSGEPERGDMTLLAQSLRADGFDASEDGTGRGMPIVAVRTANTGANDRGISADVAHTLDGANGQAVGYTIHGTDKTARVASEASVAGAIRTKAPGSQENSSTTVAVTGAAVRRLTPTECARLQGFPDDWLDLPGAADGPKYKALGNAVTVPVIEYLGRRIMESEQARMQLLDIAGAGRSA